MLLLVCLLATLPAAAQRLDPQVLGMQRLAGASSEALQPRFERGFPRFVRMDVAAPGADPVSAARAFLATNADFYGRGLPADPRRPGLRQTDLVLAHLDASALGGLAEVVRFGERYAGLPVFGSSLVVALRQPATGEGRAEALTQGPGGMPPAPLASPAFRAIFALALVGEDGPHRGCTRDDSAVVAR